MRDGATGFIVAPDDDATLAERIGRLLDDAELRERLGRAGHELARAHHSHDSLFDRNLDVHRRVTVPAVPAARP